MITFHADSVMLSGPRESDGSYRVTFRTGDYETKQLSDLLQIPREQMITVRVYTEGEEII